MLEAVTDKTRVVMLNSPNNPTGCIYPEESLKELAQGLEAFNAKRDKPILLLSDEPYRFLTYDNASVPSLPKIYRYTVVISSFSKNLSLAGERIGYVALAPDMPGKEELLSGIVFTNRILGYVNAPAIGQALLLKALGHQVDVGIYAERRAAMCKVLDAAGYEYAMPKGRLLLLPQGSGRRRRGLRGGKLCEQAGAGRARHGVRHARILPPDLLRGQEGDRKRGARGLPRP